METAKKTNDVTNTAAVTAAGAVGAPASPVVAKKKMGKIGRVIWGVISDISRAGLTAAVILIFIGVSQKK